LLSLVVAGTSCTPAPLPDLTITRVSTSVYCAIGETQPPTYENWGHNNNLSFVVTAAGVLVVNGGDNYALAKSLHREIRTVTNAPVLMVINENGQGHAFLGNSYWQEQGVPIIAHEDAVQEITERGASTLATMQARSRERGAGTFVAVPSRSFAGQRNITLGELRVELISFGKAHSPGDISVWIPSEKLLIAGDIAFHERLLGIFPDTDVLAWLRSFEAMAQLEPSIVVPGHGRPTNLAEITRYTYDYLQFLVDEVNRILENDGDLSDAYAIDQSAYAHLDTFDELAVKNAGRVYQALEMEFF
jgi:glyoxylase-like metal-dependent hydrolase (beta-lactamase superfamily II)